MDAELVDIPSFSDIAKKYVLPGRMYYTQDDMKRIYTDWANHYLERSSRHKRLIVDLQADITDGVLLADIIEAVTNERLRDIKAKPKNAAQMLENITVCLKCIENLGVNTEGLRAEDIREGNLRAILGLFFSLSRYKQQIKSALQQQSSQLQPPSTTPTVALRSDAMLSKLPSPFKSTNTNRNSTGTMPLPAQNTIVPTSGQNRRSLTSAQKDKIASAGPSSGIPAPRLAQTSRPVSPGASASPHSLIPPPSTKLSSSADKGARQNRSNSSISSGVSAVSSTTKLPPPTISVTAPGSRVPVDAAMGKHSVFPGFGFFHKNKQEKAARNSSGTRQSGDRNSGTSTSSSGFSSAKSADNSDSSVTGNENRSVTPSHDVHVDGKETIYETTTTTTNSPKMAIKALAKKTFVKNMLKDSPKLSRAEEQIRTPLPTRAEPEPVSSRIPAKVAKVPNVVLKPETRSTKRELSQIATVIEEEICTSTPLAKPDIKPYTVIKVNNEIVTTKKSPSGPGKSSATTPPTPTSGIPRPPTAGRTAPNKSGKPEKRLSFPPRDPATTSVQEVSQPGVTDGRPTAPEISEEKQENTGRTDKEECDRSDIDKPDLARTNTLGNSDQTSDLSDENSLCQNSDNPYPGIAISAHKEDPVWKFSHDFLAESGQNREENSDRSLLETDSVKLESEIEPVMTVKPMPQLPTTRNISLTPRRNSSSSSKQGSEGSSQGLRGAKSESRSNGSATKVNGCYGSDQVNMGYLSDGDILRSSSLVPHLKLLDEDALSGYTSEGSAGTYQQRMQNKQKERMPIVKEQQRTSRSGKPLSGLDLEENGANDTAREKFDRNGYEPASHLEQRYPYSTLHNRSGEAENPFNSENFRSTVPAMPVLHSSSSANTNSNRLEDSPRRPRPAPVTPPPRDPETTLSTHNPRLINGASYANGSSNMDNYLRIYASPVRKQRTPQQNGDAFNGQNVDLTIRDAGKPDFPHSDGGKYSGNMERRTKLKVSGSTQTSPQELQLRHNQSLSSNSPYSTNSLNRNIARHGPNGGNGFFQENSQNAPPRCRSVVQHHLEMSVAPVAPVYSDLGDFSGNGQGNGPMSPRMNKTSTSRFSMPNQAQELTAVNIDPNRYDTVDSVANTAALPPKSSRSSRHPTTHNDFAIYDKLGHNGMNSRSSTDHHHQNGHSSPSPSVRERSPAHSSSSKSESRNYPLSYSMHVHNNYSNVDDLDTCSNASFPLNTTRSSAPGSPLLVYSLPRSGHGSLSMRTAPGISPYVGSLLAKIHAKDDETHGSAGSLVSTTSSMYSSPEERHAHEVRKLRRELEQAQERVASLSTQLSTNTHVVAAFENSLNNMTQRLENLTTHSQRKDGELSEMRRIIDVVRQQGAQAGLISGSPTSPSLVRRHTFNSTKDVLSENQEKHQGLSRQLSTDSVASLHSVNSNGSGTSHQLDEDGKKKKKKSWVNSPDCKKIRSSFSKAFSRSRSKTKNDPMSEAEGHKRLMGDLSCSVPNSPLMQNHRTASRMANGHHVSRAPNGAIKPANSSSALDRMEEHDETVLIEDLQRQLREKEMTLTDYQLQAVKSAQQLDQYKEDVLRMRNEMETLRQDNMRLHRLVAVKRRSVSSERKSPHDGGARSTPSESGIGDDESPTFDARRLPVKVVTTEDDGSTTACEGDLSIGSVKVGPLLRWDQLDKTVQQIFREYVNRVDVKLRDQNDQRDQTNLGLTTESIAGYHLGTALRNRDEVPTLDSSPIDYVKCDDEKIRIVLRGSRDHAVDTIAFESLIPKSFFQRYISLIAEHKRVILCGPSGTGKSFLARKMAQHLALKNGKCSTGSDIASFSVDQKSSKDLRQYLLQIAEQCESSNAVNVPSVVIIDNLHHVGSLGEVFNGFLSVKHHRCPFIIGTMNQATCSPANLQLHHNFRWILCANHMEPVKGFLGRYLRRKIIEHELAVGVCDSALTKIVDWIPKVWHHINTFLEKHSSSDVTVGPRLFLDCPMNIRDSQDWFTVLWNYSLVPYILEAVKEGLQLYGRCAPSWEDPTEWILQHYPWPSYDKEEDPVNHSLTRLRPEDVGFETYGLSSGSGNKNSSIPFIGDVRADPLSDMLSTLQEVALSQQNSIEKEAAERLASSNQRI